MGAMSRLQRPVVSDRWFFLTLTVNNPARLRAANEGNLRLRLRYPLFIGLRPTRSRYCSGACRNRAFLKAHGFKPPSETSVKPQGKGAESFAHDPPRRKLSSPKVENHEPTQTA